mgnify:CR=1 FL=1
MSGEKLEKLMKIKGAIAACHFTADGKLLEHKGDIPREIVEMAAKVFAANNMMAQTQLEALSALAKAKFAPLLSWAVAGGDFLICVAGHYGIVVKLSEADLNLIYKELSEVARE